MVLKIDLQGNLEWSKVWGKKYFAGGDGIALFDANFYVTGRGFHMLKKYIDVFVFKCDKDGGKTVEYTAFLENLLLHLRGFLFWPLKMGVFEKGEVKVAPVVKISSSMGSI